MNTNLLVLGTLTILCFIAILAFIINQVDRNKTQFIINKKTNDWMIQQQEWNDAQTELNKIRAGR